MHIQHITLDLKDGGTSRALSNLILNDIHNEHSVICIKSFGNAYKLVEPKCKFIMNLNLENPIVDFLRIIKFTLKAKPDVIQTWLYHCDLLGSLLAFSIGHKRLVWNIRCSLNNRKQFKFTTNLVIRICKILSYFSPKKISVCSERSLKDHLKIGYIKGKFKIIPNGVDTNIFYPDQSIKRNFRNHYKLNHDDFILGMVARYDVQKDHVNLLEALHILRNKDLHFKCFLIGSGIDKDNQKLMEDIKIRNLENNIFLCGYISKLNFFYNGIDFHVLSSKSEGSPNVTLEAMACGKPCISTDNGDSSKIIANSGWICPVSDPLKLSKCIEMASKESKSDIKRRQIQSLKIIQSSYSIKKMVDQYSCLYSDVVNH